MPKKPFERKRLLQNLTHNVVGEPIPHKTDSMSLKSRYTNLSRKLSRLTRIRQKTKDPKTKELIKTKMLAILEISEKTVTELVDKDDFYFYPTATINLADSYFRHGFESHGAKLLEKILAHVDEIIRKKKNVFNEPSFLASLLRKLESSGKNNQLNTSNQEIKNRCESVARDSRYLINNLPNFMSDKFNKH